MVASFGVMFTQAQVPMDQLVRGFLVPSLPREDVPTVRKGDMHVYRYMLKVECGGRAAKRHISC